MFIDMHMHEMTCSKDSFLKLDQIVSIAREKGLGAVCITDHDSMGLREYAAGSNFSLCRETLWPLGSRIIPGSG